MNKVMNNIRTDLVRNIGSAIARFIKKNSSDILTGITVVTGIAAPIEAVIAKPYADERLEKATTEKGEDLTFWEKVKVASPYYIPTAVTVLAGSASAICCRVKDKKTIESMAGAYALLATTYHEFRGGTDKVFGQGAQYKVDAELARTADDHCIYSTSMFQETVSLGSLDKCERLFYDTFSKRYFISTIGNVLDAQIAINRNLMLRGEAFVNEYYELLGLEDFKKPEYDHLCWDQCRLFEECEYSLLDVDYNVKHPKETTEFIFHNESVKLDENTEVIMLSFMYDPEIPDESWY